MIKILQNFKEPQGRAPRKEGTVGWHWGGVPHVTRVSWGGSGGRREGRKGSTWRTLASFLLENEPRWRPRPCDGGGRVLGKVSGVETVFFQCSHPPDESTLSCDKGLPPQGRAPRWPIPQPQTPRALQLFSIPHP